MTVFLDDVLWAEYGNFLMNNTAALASEGVYINNGDTLTSAMESCIMMEEFIATLQSRNATIH